MSNECHGGTICGWGMAGAAAFPVALTLLAIISRVDLRNLGPVSTAGVFVFGNVSNRGGSVNPLVPLDFRIRGLKSDEVADDPLAGEGTAGGANGLGCDAFCCRALANSNIASSVRRLEDDKEEPGPKSACSEDSSSITSAIPLAVTYVIVIVLILFSGLFSGLTLGLMGLDVTGLEIVMEGGDAANAAAAEKIYPIRKNGNLLLCTLLLGNVAVNALLSILTADIWGGLVGFFSSTAVIVILGEILPQAACSRYALQVGSRTIPLVKVIMCLLYPLAFPVAFMLDKILGHELGTTYSKAEMTKLLEIHVKEGRFDQETGTAMTGALKYQDVLVKEVMAPIENTFMLDAEEKLSFDTIAKIFKTGYSRIPVYEVSVNNVIGLLFTKDLIFIDPEDETQVRSFVQIFGRGLHVVWPDDKLGDVLRELKQGHSHMALVRDVNQSDGTQDPFYEIRGIITLEDIIEVILGDEIVDETDAFVDQLHSTKVDREADFDWARLRLLDSKIVDETLSDEEVMAVTAHLRANHGQAVELLSKRQLTRMIAETPVTELAEAEMEVGMDLPDDILYKKGAPSDVCTLILGGRVTVLAGSDNFKSDVSSWAVLASNALANPTYIPDFSAYVSEKCRCLRLTRARFIAALDASTAEKLKESLRGGLLSKSSEQFEDENIVVEGAGGKGLSSKAGANPSVVINMDQNDVVEGAGGKGLSSKAGANPSVVINMDQNDVVIDMKEKEVAIDMSAIDKVHITSNGGDENPTATTTITAITPNVLTGDSKENSTKRVVFSVETQGEKGTSDASDSQADAGKHMKKRKEKRKATRDRRSRLLAAFLHKREGSNRSVGENNESSVDGSDNRRDNDECPETDRSPLSSPQMKAMIASPEPLKSLQSQLTDGGKYTPTPSQRSVPTQTTSATKSGRLRSASFQFIEPKKDREESDSRLRR
eukprot:CAMPEP_0113541842 /NCGR_PEP_ID=MMETSP0015_2-20120614/9269_1 /TAXON_ID=2838 /ORGANISM="Odontella" /LENGTH=938 /DNA_ID=CAMNT_0000441819 /DNA_START=97 /DNA_END=2914 /DNA_ORIENTATION=- /assembly_acc=CAM_ASM_000160